MVSQSMFPAAAGWSFLIRVWSYPGLWVRFKDWLQRRGLGRTQGGVAGYPQTAASHGFVWFYDHVPYWNHHKMCLYSTFRQHPRIRCHIMFFSLSMVGRPNQTVNQPQSPGRNRELGSDLDQTPVAIQFGSRYFLWCYTYGSSVAIYFILT